MSKKEKVIVSTTSLDGNYLGLDVSSSIIGVSILDKNKKLVVLDAVKLTSTNLNNLFEKADKGLEEIKKIVGNNKIEKIFVEANAKMFTKGFSSADTLMTLAKINALISYLTYKEFKAEVIDVNVTSARKAIGFKGNKEDKRPKKEQVFEFVTTLHPEFPYKKHIAKTGKSKGQEIFNIENKDMVDSWVICYGGMCINKF